MSKHKYVPCSLSDIPAGVRFDVSRRNACLQQAAIRLSTLL